MFIFLTQYFQDVDLKQMQVIAHKNLLASQLSEMPMTPAKCEWVHITFK